MENGLSILMGNDQLTDLDEEPINPPITWLKINSFLWISLSLQNKIL